MMTYAFRTASAALLMAIGGLPIFACPPQVITVPVSAPADPVATAAPESATHQHFRAKQILGTKILIANNTAIGTVEDLVFDNAGNLDYLIVSTESDKLVSVPFDAAKWDLEKKVGTVTITADQYKTIPTYTTTTYPSFYTPAYRVQTYKFYGLTPRELRRIDRRDR